MSYKYTTDAFKKLIDTETEIATWESNPIDVQELCSLGLDGLNEVVCDDAVESGYLIEDISYVFIRIEDGHAIIQATGHAGSWLAEINETEDED